jgi:hypothetical protein
MRGKCSHTVWQRVADRGRTSTTDPDQGRRPLGRHLPSAPTIPPYLAHLPAGPPAPGHPSFLFEESPNM